MDSEPIGRDELAARGNKNLDTHAEVVREYRASEKANKLAEARAADEAKAALHKARMALQEGKNIWEVRAMGLPVPPEYDFKMEKAPEHPVEYAAIKAQPEGTRNGSKRSRNYGSYGRST
ncbi:MAG: hypothetical protein UZ22_OP11002000441 [Microgenomates bacterium OLB23]|nr:MAG: hypothetical protein UZ22_OP11002000441 [Microgenomates bacterium OLB23]